LPKHTRLARHAGWRLNSPLLEQAKSAQEILNGFIQNPELSNWKLNPEYIKLTSNVWAERVDIFPSERSSFVRANADSHGRINQIEFNSPLAITEIFKSNGVSGQDFIKRYMDAYSIPEMQNVKNMTGMVDYQYLSPEGVRTYIRLFKNNYGEMIPLFIQITKVVSKREFIQNITME